jgi:hypothetical protein
MIFVNIGGRDSSSRRTAINLGIGHRLLIEDDMAIVGVNFFTDYETKARAVPATFLSKVVAWLSCLMVGCALFQL